MSSLDDVTEEEAMQLIAQLLDQVNIKRSSAIIEGESPDGVAKYLLVEASLVPYDSFEEANAAAALKSDEEGAPPNENLH